MGAAMSFSGSDKESAATATAPATETGISTGSGTEIIKQTKPSEVQIYARDTANIIGIARLLLLLKNHHQCRSFFERWLYRELQFEELILLSDAVQLNDSENSETRLSSWIRDTSGIRLKARPAEDVALAKEDSLRSYFKWLYQFDGITFAHKNALLNSMCDNHGHGKPRSLEQAVMWILKFIAPAADLQLDVVRLVIPTATLKPDDATAIVKSEPSAGN